jgi:hypothetical protein
MLSPRLFAEDIDGSPRGEGEKTSNPILKRMHNNCNACILQCLSELANLRHPRPLAGLQFTAIYRHSRKGNFRFQRTCGCSPRVVVETEQVEPGNHAKASLGGPTLYAANFHNGTVDVFDSSFHAITGGFVDPNLPANYAPFGIASIDNLLFVTLQCNNELVLLCPRQQLPNFGMVSDCHLRVSRAWQRHLKPQQGLSRALKSFHGRQFHCQ